VDHTDPIRDRLFFPAWADLASQARQDPIKTPFFPPRIIPRQIIEDEEFLFLRRFRSAILYGLILLLGLSRQTRSVKPRSLIRAIAQSHFRLGNRFHQSTASWMRLGAPIGQRQHHVLYTFDRCARQWKILATRKVEIRARRVH